MWKLMIATLIAAGTTTAAAQPHPYDRNPYRQQAPEIRWTHLATRAVDGAERRDIAVGKAAGAFHTLKIEATRGVPRVTRVEVLFGDGQRQEMTLNQKMDRSNPQAVIDLPGNDRYIERVWVTTDRDSYGELMVSGA